MYVIVTFRDETGKFSQGELVSPFSMEGDMLYLLGKDGDPLAYTVAQAVGDDIVFRHVAQEQVEKIQALVV